MHSRMMDRDTQGRFSVVTMEVWTSSASEEEEEEKSSSSLTANVADEEKKCHNSNNNNNNNNDSLCREVTQGETQVMRWRYVGIKVSSVAQVLIRNCIYIEIYQMDSY